VSGPDESLRALLRPLIPLGVEPHLILPRPGPQVGRYEETGVRLHYAPISILRRQLSPKEIVLFPPNLMRGALAVARVARRIGADLIHTNMEVVLDGALAARWLGLPHVLHYRGNSLDQPAAVFDVLTWIWTTLSERVFCISDATATIFTKRNRSAKVETLYNPIDIAAFSGGARSAEVRASLGAGEDEILVGTVGRIHPRKDLETFVRAAAIAGRDRPRARFVVVGAPEGAAEEAYLSQVRATAASLGMSERLLFAGARRDMPAVFRALDVFVLSSRHEGFGRVVAEAMAAGIPSVVTREGALPELVIEGTSGLCARATDAQDFATRIGQLIDDPALRASLGASARSRARNFDALACAEHVMATYRTLVGPTANLSSPPAMV
jgi:glycosyltransferase involved in cell wall biosynthesis